MVKKGLKVLLTALASLAVVAFVAVFAVVPGPLINTAARVGPGLAFAQVDGRDVVIFAYVDSGYSGLPFFLPGALDTRVAAIDVDTGASVWDRSLGNGSMEATTLAAGRDYAYLLDSFELTVVDLEDGSVIARSGDIDGLEDLDVFQSEIFYSDSRRAIMLRPDDGRVRAIAIDSLTAVVVDDRTRSTWECVLDRMGHAYFSAVPDPVLSERTHTDAGELGFGVPAGSAPGTPGERLSRPGADGSPSTVGTEAFVAPGFVAESTHNEPLAGACPDAAWADDVFPEGESRAVALGTDSGYAVIEHDASARDDARAISVVDAVDGALLGTNPAEGGTTHARRGPDGGSVLIVDRYLPGVLPSLSVPVTSVVLLVSPEGSMREVVIAKHGWFGMPW
ncbi:hypothetical protein QF046_003110 [Microbacterium sp. W4I4]|uniref:PA2928 family protein n=1 Tax=Microbacterium sp. W4I4 TaxID=3042295 RepID=UPI002782EC82|nr:PA2928 family protein [Microbacterium sp. W4I4]MDQ0615469.1 hypothetical protein [Microbacterium sp. W4I4]